MNKTSYKKSFQAKLTADEMRLDALVMAGSQPGDIARVWKYRGGVTVEHGGLVVLSLNRAQIALNMALPGWDA